MVVGLILLAIGPLVGLVPSMVGLAQSFHAVDATSDPRDKARTLASGISLAMNSTLFGLVLAGIGIVVFFVSLFIRLRGGRRAGGGTGEPADRGPSTSA